MEKYRNKVEGERRNYWKSSKKEKKLDKENGFAEVSATPRKMEKAVSQRKLCEGLIVEKVFSSGRDDPGGIVFPGVPGSVRSAEKDPASLKIVHFTVI